MPDKRPLSPYLFRECGPREDAKPSPYFRTGPPPGSIKRNRTELAQRVMRNELARVARNHYPTAAPKRRCRVCDKLKTINCYPANQWALPPGAKPRCSNCAAKEVVRRANPKPKGAGWRKSNQAIFLKPEGGPLEKTT